MPFLFSPDYIASVATIYCNILFEGFTEQTECFSETILFCISDISFKLSAPLVSILF